jgi:hypothetical protein
LALDKYKDDLKKTKIQLEKQKQQEIAVELK